MYILKILYFTLVRFCSVSEHRFSQMASMTDYKASNQNNFEQLADGLNLLESYYKNSSLLMISITTTLRYF